MAHSENGSRGERIRQLRGRFEGRSDIEIALILEERLRLAHMARNAATRVAEDAIDTLRQSMARQEKDKEDLERLIKTVKG